MSALKWIAGLGLGAWLFRPRRSDASGGSGVSLSREQLQAIVGNSPNLDTLLPGLQRALSAFDFENTEAALFLGVTAAETNGYRALTESWVADGYSRPGQQYEGRSGLGNVRPGDGERFKGRGLIQLTGRNNYTHFSKWIGRDDILVQPNAVASDAYLATAAAVWYWTHYKAEDTGRTCRAIARDSSLTFEQKILGVNGTVYRGLERPSKPIAHLETRQAYSRRALQALQTAS